MDEQDVLLRERDDLSVFHHNEWDLYVEYSAENRFQLGKGERWHVYLNDYPFGVFASVIRMPGSYGYEFGLYEMAFCTEKDGILPIFNKAWGGSVLGYLDEEQVIHWIDVLMESMGLD